MPSPFTPGESSRIREQFPPLARETFLNAASLVPLSLPGREAVVEFTTDLSERGFAAIAERGSRIEEIRTAAARLVGATADEIAFITNTSDGVSLVASGFPFMDGDEVIVPETEFPSNVHPWKNLERKGVKVVMLPCPDGRVPVERVAVAMTGRTRMVALSAVQFSTGFRADLAAVADIAHDRGAMLFVDAIQAAGAIPLDVKEMGIDFLSTGGHKWLCGPVGAGFFYCRADHIDRLALTRVGWHTVRQRYDFWDLTFAPDPTARRFEEGSPNFAGILGLGASLELVAREGIDRNFAQILTVADRLMEGIEGAGLTLLSSRVEEERSGIVIFSAGEPAANKRLFDRLTAAGVRITIQHGDRQLRVSPHFFNILDDAERFIGALR